MPSIQPITDAVYGKRSTARKPVKAPRRRPVQSLAGDLLGEEKVADIYRGLGFKRPSERPKRGR